MRCLAFGLFFLLFQLIPAARADVPVPPLQARVTDLTGTLNAAQKAALEQTLQAFEARRGSQVAVLIVPTTQPETIEQYSIRVAEAWKLGRKGIDDGALLLVAKDDHALRIEVGYGLEGVVPDVVAKRLVSDVIVPYFKQGDFYGGIEAGVDRLIRVIEGEPLPPPRKQVKASWSSFEDLLPGLLIAVFVVGGVLRALLGRFLGASAGATVAAVVFWFLVGSLLAAAAVWFVAFLFILMGGGRTGPGGFGGFGGSGGGFGGGGFSGGGGGFGGGGASGRW